MEGVVEKGHRTRWGPLSGPHVGRAEPQYGPNATATSPLQIQGAGAGDVVSGGHAVHADL